MKAKKVWECVFNRQEFSLQVQCVDSPHLESYTLPTRCRSTRKKTLFLFKIILQYSCVIPCKMFELQHVSKGFRTRYLPAADSVPLCHTRTSLSGLSALFAFNPNEYKAFSSVSIKPTGRFLQGGRTKKTTLDEGLKI